ncbi:hypothetical protein TNCV_5074741 [Trichonephila clavipes]|nr:hypothetical protein TNCV_5074741 [Trichonephila clavipes]
MAKGTMQLPFRRGTTWAEDGLNRMPVGPRKIFYFPSSTYWKTNRGIPRSVTCGRALLFSVGLCKVIGLYADKPQMLDYLEDNIRRVIADIRPQMLEKVIENWTSRLDYIRASRGSAMPEII